MGYNNVIKIKITNNPWIKDELWTWWTAAVALKLKNEVTQSSLFWIFNGLFFQVVPVETAADRKLIKNILLFCRNFVESNLQVCLKNFMCFAVFLKYSLKVCSINCFITCVLYGCCLRQLIFQAGLGPSVSFLNDTLKTVNCHINIDYVSMILWVVG